MIKRLLPLTLLGACAAAQTPVVGGSEQTCNAGGLDDLVGKPGTAELGADALKRSGAKRLRWIQPGTMVTMDFRRDRLNIHLDDHNIVTRVNCG
ncbi:MAG TPA: I78 family peptidase inhibitor [Sphingomonas sp.]